jgi:hypothetical protein
MILPEVPDQVSRRVAGDHNVRLPAFHWDTTELSITSRGRSTGRVRGQPRRGPLPIRSILTMLASLAHR